MHVSSRVTWSAKASVRPHTMWTKSTDLLDSLLGFLDMFAVVCERARRILELSLDFRKLIIELIDQFRQSLYFSAFCQFLSVSSRPTPLVKSAHSLPPLLNLLDLTLHSLTLLSSPLNLLLTFLDFPLRSCQVLLCLFGLVDGDSPFVGLDQAGQSLQLRCCLLIFQVTPLFCPQLLEFGINLFLQ
jgi:hypothetical protein